MRRPLALAALAATAAGCSYNGVDSLPLPGGAGGGSGSYMVSATFSDVGNLVPRESCRTNDVAVGTITSITVTPDLRAKVVCRLSGSVHLPANTVATIETTSLLGEAFVALGPPPGVAPEGNLPIDRPIPETDTHTDPNVEEILGALSAVLRGGDLGDLQTITTELNNALSGRQSDVRALLADLRAFTGRLNQHRGDITAALEGLDRLSRTLAKQRQTIGAALDSIPAGLRVLDAERPALIRSLQTLDRLAVIGTRVVHESGASTVADLKLLSPTLAGLAKNGQDIAKALQLLPDFPFPADTLAAIKGDYAGFYGTVNFSLDSLNTLLAQEGFGTTKTTKTAKHTTGGPKPDRPAQDGLRNLLGSLLGLVPTPHAPKVTLHRLLSVLHHLSLGGTG